MVPIGNFFFPCKIVHKISEFLNMIIHICNTYLSFPYLYTTCSISHNKHTYVEQLTLKTTNNILIMSITYNT